MDGPTWDDLKPEIERLYMRENKPLKDVMRILHTSGFTKSKGQYTKKFKEWGFQKNQTSQDWKYISRKIEKRKHQDRKSEVYIHGVRCPPSKVQKEISRHFQSTMEKYIQAAHSPRTPEGILVCSPPPPVEHIELDPESPWFQFLNVMGPQIDQVTTISQSPRSLCLNGIESRDFNLLQVFMERNHIKTTVPHIATVLDMIMPEDPVQHRDIACALLSTDGALRIPQVLTLGLFLLSNNLVDLTEDNMGVYRRIMMEIFQNTGSRSFRHLKNLPRSAEITTFTIVERIFTTAVKCGDLETTRILLEAGLCTNLVLVPCNSQESIPLLSLAASLENERLALEMVQLLFSYKAPANQGADNFSPLSSALVRRHKDVANLLLSHGALVTPWALRYVVEQEDVPLIERFLETSVNINARTEWTRSDTILGTAVRKGNSKIIQLLLNAGGDIHGANRCSSDTKDEFYDGWTIPLGIAAHNGDVEAAKLLLNDRINCNFYPTDSVDYVPPLLLAVASGHNDITKLLLDAGVDVDQAEEADETTGPTLIERIIVRQNPEDEDIYTGRALLAKRGIPGSPTLSALVLATVRGKIQFARLLVEFGAHRREILDRSPHPSVALRRLHKVRHLERIRFLRQCEVTAIGDGMSSLQQISLGFYLHQAGLLSKILQDSGALILSCAILAGQIDWVQLLLTFPIDISVDPYPIASPLEAAVSMENYQLIDHFIFGGACVTENVINAAVWRACTTGKYDIVHKLLGSPNALPSEAPPAFLMAILAKRHDIAQLLLNAGIGATGKLWRQYCNCCARDDKERFKKHTGWWRGVGFPRDHHSVLRIAVEEGDGFMLELILERGRFTPNEIAQAVHDAAVTGHKHLVEALLAALIAGRNVNCEYGHPFFGSSTPLLAAVESRQITWVKMLLEAGAAVNYRGRKEGLYRTPLQQAAEDGSPEIVDILLQNGAKVNARPPSDHGATALQFAAIKGNLLIAKKLIDVGANINARRALILGRTALEGAAENGRLEVLHLLISKGAKISGGGRSQYIRAIKMAEQNLHMAAATLLKTHGGWTSLDADWYAKEDVESEELDLQDDFMCTYDTSDGESIQQSSEEGDLRDKESSGSSGDS